MKNEVTAMKPTDWVVEAWGQTDINPIIINASQNNKYINNSECRLYYDSSLITVLIHVQYD